MPDRRRRRRQHLRPLLRPPLFPVRYRHFPHIRLLPTKKTRNTRKNSVLSLRIRTVWTTPRNDVTGIFPEPVSGRMIRKKTGEITSAHHTGTNTESRSHTSRTHHNRDTPPHSPDKHQNTDSDQTPPATAPQTDNVQNTSRTHHAAGTDTTPPKAAHPAQPESVPQTNSPARVISILFIPNVPRPASTAK